MAPQTQAANGRAYDFAPVDFDGETIEPDAYPGAYEATCDAIKVSRTGNGSFPMLIVEWKLDSTEEESDECQQSIGAIVTDFLTFFPEGDRRQKMGKVKYRALCDKLELAHDTVPKQLRSKADFDAFIDAVKGKSIPVWVTSKEQNGETRINVNYEAPRNSGSGSLAPLDDGDGEEPEEKPKGKASAKKAATKSSRR